MSARRTVWTAVAGVALMLATACGGGGGGSERPSVDDVSDGLQESGSGGLPNEEQADCAAELLVGADVPDETLRELADGGQEIGDLDLDDDRLTLQLLPQVLECYSLVP